ncbi:MAG TPA: serine/threonine-protein kinase [Pyrinomonadaceae bacterium]|jgi:serine/threonine protein kinase
MISPGTILQERYLIEKQIGAGGMGTVYLAVDQRFDNYVAIKETFYKDDEFGEAFEREAKILNGLLHPVLPHVSDYFTEGDEHFLVMQFIEGEDVSEILKRGESFSVRDVLRWTDNLLDALDFLHSQDPPIIHRDLKPSNLKISPRGDVFLLDFGLAKLKKDNTLSERSVFGYSRRYSPLEQIQGTGTDARSDIFALGATVYHLLTGSPPLDAITRASAIVAGNPDPLQRANEVAPEIPDALANVLNSALALNPAARFQSAAAMRQALKHAFAENEENIADLSANEPAKQFPRSKGLSYAESIAQAVIPVAPSTMPETAEQWTQNNQPATSAGVENLTYAEAMRQALKRIETRNRAEDLDNARELENAQEQEVEARAAAIEDEPAEPPDIQEPQIVYSPENEEFPALEAYAEAVGAQEEAHDERETNEVDFTPLQAPPSAAPPPIDLHKTVAPPAIEFHKTVDADVPTVVAPRNKRSRPAAAAMLALLAIVATASALFIFRDQKSGEPDPAPVEVTSEIKSDANESETEPPNSEQPEVRDAPKSEITREVKTKAFPAGKNNEKLREEAAPEITEPIRERSAAEKSAPNPVANPRIKRQAKKPETSNVDRSERIVRSEPVPDIESIFTGRPSWQRHDGAIRREERRRAREEMTEEEWREYRRRRRQQRRENSYPIPY